MDAVLTKALAAAALVSALACASSPTLRARPREDPLARVDARTLEAQGREFLAAGDAIRAEQYFAAALSKGASPDRIVPDLISLCLRSSRHRAALGYALPHLRRHPEDWALMNLVAVLYFVAGQPENSERLAAEAAILAPDRPEPAYVRAMALARLGRDAAARKEMERYLSLAPRGPHAAEARQALRAGKERR